MICLGNARSGLLIAGVTPYALTRINGRIRSVHDRSGKSTRALANDMRKAVDSAMRKLVGEPAPSHIATAGPDRPARIHADPGKTAKPGE